MGARFCSLYHEIHYIKVRYIKVCVYVIYAKKGDLVMTELTIEESFTITCLFTLWLLEKPLGQTLWEVDLGKKTPTKLGQEKIQIKLLNSKLIGRQFWYFKI